MHNPMHIMHSRFGKAEEHSPPKTEGCALIPGESTDDTQFHEVRRVDTSFPLEPPFHVGK
jgi:hypothetical protein